MKPAKQLLGYLSDMPPGSWITGSGHRDLRRCGVLFYSCNVNKYTYANEALGHYSIIDYMFCSDIDNITKFVVMDEGIYLTDHG